MINSSLKQPFEAVDADDFNIEIIMRSRKHDCHTAYRLSTHEIDNDLVVDVIRDMRYRLMDFIREKDNG